MRKVRWGVLSSALIGVEKVIPAMQQGRYSNVIGLASRDLGKARTVASHLGIPKTYASYDDLINDPEIEAIYNPLPNHLHVPWSVKAIEAGKHVLCEKPIALTAAEGQILVDAARAHPELKVMEAFMYRHHPQWVKTKALVKAGAIGELRTINTFFSYFNDDPHNIRNMADIGGGGLMDIGCYAISVARFIFDDEPSRVVGTIDFAPMMKVARRASAIMDFAGGTATFTCSTQLAPYQRVNIFGTTGHIEIEIPFNAPPDKPCKIWLQTGDEIEEIVFDIVDQYTVQGDLFSKAILDDLPVPTPIEDSVANMQVIEAVFKSDGSGVWEQIG